MRLFLALLALSACATHDPGAPDRIARGCWIDRGEKTTTMRWLPDRAGTDRAGADRLIGDKLVYGAEGAEASARYALERRGEGWVFCDFAEAAAAPAPCWPVSGAPSGAVQPGRVVIQGDAELLHITRLAGEEVEDVYFGRRDGCD